MSFDDGDYQKNMAQGKLKRVATESASRPESVSRPESIAEPVAKPAARAARADNPAAGPAGGRAIPRATAVNSPHARRADPDDVFEFDEEVDGAGSERAGPRGLSRIRPSPSKSQSPSKSSDGHVDGPMRSVHVRMSGGRRGHVDGGRGGHVDGASKRRRCDDPSSMDVDTDEVGRAELLRLMST